MFEIVEADALFIDHYGKQAEALAQIEEAVFSLR
jgi:hypothetical protein